MSFVLFENERIFLFFVFSLLNLIPHATVGFFSSQYASWYGLTVHEYSRRSSFFLVLCHNAQIGDLGGTRSTPLFLINLILYTSHHKYTLRPSTPTDTYMNMYVTSYTGYCNTRMQIRDRRRARCTLRRRTFGAWHDEALCTVPRLLYTFQPIMMSTRIRCVHSAPRPHQRASGTAPSG